MEMQHLYNRQDKMIIFDLDGTLWDSSQSVAESWNIEIERVTGVSPNFTADDIARNMGKTMNEIADDVMPQLPPDERYALARSCEIFENKYITEHGGRLYEGVRETIDMLAKAGYKLSIVSNCQEGYIPAFLISMDMGRYFMDYEEWGRSGLPKAQNIRLVMERNGVADSDAIYVGDIQNDANAASEAGIPCIWAQYGFGSIDRPAAILESFKDLPEILASLRF